MKKPRIFLYSLLMIFGLAMIAGASPVSYTIDGSGSSVSLSSNSISDTCGSAAISAALNTNLDGISGTIAEGNTHTIDFFDLTVIGDGWAAADTYNIEATLAFSQPSGSASGSGDGCYCSAFSGVINGGTLYWDDSTLPDVLTLSDGTSLSIDFEEGFALGCGADDNTATVHAYITNIGSGSGAAPVPEPATVLLMGIGLIGLVVGCRLNRQH